MVQIEWSKAAKIALKEIFDYISQDSQQYAEYFIERIYETIENLEFFPQMGKRVPESDNPNVKELLCQNYRIIYQEIEEKVEIITIIHGSRLLRI